MKKGIWILFLVLLMIGMITLCFSQLRDNPDKSKSKNEIIHNVTLGKNVVDANNLLAFDLYSKYKTNEGNLFFSPYSISSALIMTYEGAEGKTSDEIKKVLHLPDIKDELRSESKVIYDGLNNKSVFYNLSVANALWAQDKFPFKETYFNVIENYYNGYAKNLDFISDTENSRLIINNWVENQTNNKIKDLIPKETINKMTRLVLTNAIYFKANWSNQFDILSTTEEDFILDSGDKVNVSMMHKLSYYNYLEYENVKILEMEYRGKDISMLIILPKENDISGIEDLLNENQFLNWRNNLSKERVSVSFPRFTFETKYKLAKDLMEMGMPTAFDGEEANFGDMYYKNQTDENLYISEVIHQTFINVSESGTEAAAATVVIMAGATSIDTEMPKIFNANHPFIFIIQQKDSGNILFIGRVNNPAE